MKLIWDKWQREVLAHQGNLTLRCGRQTGKSEVISEKAVQIATQYPNTTTMIIAASQRQSSLLFEKVRAKMDEQVTKGGVNYAEKPTLTKLILDNGSRIYSLPAGRTGYFIRGYTIDVLIVDEAAYLPSTVWVAVTPMIAVSRKTRGMGWIIMLSTPFGKGGYYYESFTDKDFKSFHVSSEDCPRMDKLFLKKEKLRMTRAEYRQEYQAEFTDEWNQFFSTDLIKKTMTFISWQKSKDYIPSANYYLGVDIARYGGDQNAFVVCELLKNNLKIVRTFTTERVSTTDTIARIEIIDKEFKFNKIFIDDGGVGGAVTDVLIDKLGRKVLGLNNASKRIEVQGEEKKRGILKEDLYSNTLMLMETGRLELISDLDLLRSLKSITFEYGDSAKGTRNVKIFGDYSHLAEAMVRACWCTKEKGLRLYMY